LAAAVLAADRFPGADGDRFVRDFVGRFFTALPDRFLATLYRPSEFRATNGN
jgi:hypothetical protein